jgi:hypothetical protein
MSASVSANIALHINPLHAIPMSAVMRFPNIPNPPVASASSPPIVLHIVVVGDLTRARLHRQLLYGLLAQDVAHTLHLDESHQRATVFGLVSTVLFFSRAQKLVYHA